MSRLPSSRFALLLLTAGVVFSSRAGLAQQRLNLSARRDSAPALPQTVQGGTDSLRTALASRTSLSLATADFNSDGTQDLVTGYATASGGALLLQAGNDAALMGQSSRPFASAAQAIAIPVRPDLLQVSNIGAHGFPDLLVAAKGDSTVYLLAGDGHGGFGAPLALTLQGSISSLRTWTSAAGSRIVAAGVCGTIGCGVQMLTQDGKTAAFIPVSGSVTSMEAGSFNGGHAEDLALIAGGAVRVVDGDSILSASPQIETLGVSGPAAALTGGHFIYSRTGNPQLAVLGMDATLHLFSRGPLDSTVPTQAESLAARRSLASSAHAAQSKLNGIAWTEVQTVPNVGPGASALMLHGHLSGNGLDDVVVMAGSQYLQVTQSVTLGNNLRTSTPVVMVDSTSAPVLAAITARTAADVRMGVITAEATLQPNYTAEFTVNRTINADTATDAVPGPSALTACQNKTTGCTLRAAALLASNDASANGTAKVDTITLVAASAYNLTATNNGSATDSVGSANYHINLEGSVNIVGGAAGAANIVDGQANDLVFNVNPGLQNASTNLDVYLSGFTVRNGANPTNNALGYNFGGAIQADVFNSGLLTLTNMTVSGSTSKLGPGGCIAVIDSNNGNQAQGGTVDLETSVFSTCKSPESGGGIETEGGVTLTANNITVTGNISGHAVNTADTGTTSLGGGLAVSDAYTATIAASTFTNNSTQAVTTAAHGGAGMYINATHGASVTSSSITNNSTLSSGGGFFIDANPASTVTLTADTITFNTISSGATAGSDGAGVFVNNNGDTNAVPALVMQYSRIHGNTGGGTHTGLYIADAQGAPASTATLNATDNWWGCNVAPTVAPCDIAGVATGAGTLTTSPYSILLIAISPPAISVGTTVVATASLAQDTAGTTYSLANDAAYLATPISSFTLTNTGTVTYNPAGGAGFSSTAAPTYSNAAATATGTATTTGSGSATIVVDGVTVTQAFTVANPPDLTVTSTHTGNFKAGDTADTYTLTASNSGGGATTGTVTVKDTLPAGFTATALSGTGWSCTLASLTCTRSDILAATSSYPAITLTVSIPSTSIGSYTNMVAVSGGGETVTSNDTGLDPTVVVAPPTLSAVFSPATVGVANPTALVFTFGNPSGNTVSLSQVAFSVNLPAGLTAASHTAVTCTSNTTSSTAGNAAPFPVTAGPVLPGETCQISYTVQGSAAGNYTEVSSTITSPDSNPGTSASAPLHIADAAVVTLGTVPATVNRGTSATFTGTVTVDSGAPAPAVQLAFYAGSTLLGSAPLTGSGTTYTATFSTSMLPSGTQLIVARYPGDTVYAAASSTGQNTFVIANNLWIGNNNATVSAYSATGVPYLTTPEASGGNGVAIDAGGNVWSAASASNAVAKFSNTGTVISAGYTGGGIATPTGVAIDGAGQVWVTNGTSSISVLTPTGTPVSPTAYTGGALNAPQSPAIDGSGNLWVVNPAGNSVTEFLGVAAPALPLATGVANNTTGSRP